MADVVEALLGAVFLDGGWKALMQVFARLATPMIFFSCKYFSNIATDLTHDIIASYDKRGKNYKI